MKKKRAVTIGVSCTAAAIAAWFAFCGYQWSWGPFAGLHDIQTANLPGNAARYAPEQAKKIAGSLLEDKHIIFLGSSVTYGASAKGVSFADYIAVRNGCSVLKEAVSGTTLVDEGIDSYISRLRALNTSQTVDLFVCQLSTNDAAQKKPLGEIGPSKELDSFDTKTVAGAIEYIIAYAREAWDCPVVFYTNPKYDSEAYAAMVGLLGKIADKWGISVIDLWNDAAFNSLSEEQRRLYLADSIHPTQAGYLEWWTPAIEKALYLEVWP